MNIHNGSKGPSNQEVLGFGRFVNKETYGYHYGAETLEELQFIASDEWRPALGEWNTEGDDKPGRRKLSPENTTLEQRLLRSLRSSPTAVRALLSHPPANTP